MDNDESTQGVIPAPPVPGFGMSGDSVVSSDNGPTALSVEETRDKTRLERVFDTPRFRRMWFAMVVSSFGDWVGFVAIVAIADRVGGSSSEAAVALVIGARMIPGFFLGPLGGVLVDRLDRRKVMVCCDIGRGLVIGSLIFVQTLPGLFLASLVLEMLTLLWTPAKEASVPALVDKKFLPNANSLSLVAAYGTFPLAAVCYALLATAARVLNDSLGAIPLSITQDRLALLFDASTFLLSALLISGISIPTSYKAKRLEKGKPGALTELREGLAFIRRSPRVRAVITGLSTGLIGGCMMVPLGQTFARTVLHSGQAGYGFLITALGLGVAAGVVGLTFLLRHRQYDFQLLFTRSIPCIAILLAVTAAMHNINLAMLFLFFFGFFCGTIYVLGFTILQVEVTEEMRGRTFASLYTLVRFCVLLALILAPLLSTLFQRLSERLFGDAAINFGSMELALPGVRLTLWLGAFIVFVAWLAARQALRMERK